MRPSWLRVAATQLLDRHSKDLALGELALKIGERRDVGKMDAIFDDGFERMKWSGITYEICAVLLAGHSGSR
jgi:hypothetical protein